LIALLSETDDSGTLITQQRYLPFGGMRELSGYSTSGLTDYTYTGQRTLDPGMGGLMDYKARFYSPLLGRFIQPDSIIPNPLNPQAWNRFSYVTNRPVNFNDPSGHVACRSQEECDDMGTTPNGNGSLGNNGIGNNNDNPLDGIEDFLNMDKGDIISIENGYIRYNFMFGLLGDGSRQYGFWDLDNHLYVSYQDVAMLFAQADRWTIFARADKKHFDFDSYNVAASSGEAFSFPSIDYYWTGGVDDNPDWVEIHTDVDYSQFIREVVNAISFPASWGLSLRNGFSSF
jgi:RHS repeat-associated protein